MTNKKHIVFVSLISLFLFVTMVSCDKFKGDQTIPSYLQVNSFDLSTDYGIQGTNNQAILDAWVYVDDQSIGTFELPALIPVLVKGPHQLKVYPGVKLNGISTTRAPYPFFTPVIYDNFEFSQDSVGSINPVTSYESNTEFVWMEDFEDASLVLEEAPGSDTGIYITNPPNNPEAFLDNYSKHSGIIYLDAERSHVLLQSNDGNGQGFYLNRGDYHFMELNIKTDVLVLVGVYIQKTDQSVEKRDYLILNITNTWKKIYVNLTPLVNDFTDADNYKIIFEAYYSGSSGTQKIYLDNIKLLSRPN